MRELENFHIKMLYEFTRQHYVEYYNVQTELVDHLVKGIEAQWVENPEIQFEEALQKEFKKFGVLGFSDVVEKRQRAMAKKYWKLIWKEAQNVLRKPKVVTFVFLLFCASYFLMTSEKGIYVLYGLVLISFIAGFVGVGRKSAALRKRKKRGENVYLLETLIITGGSYFLLWLPFHVLNTAGVPHNLDLKIIFAFLIVVTVLTSYICFYELPKKKMKS